jgi:hydrophobic/amphiphilic exporter-1 (mainly G- bacteria), HAE1 family
MACPTALAIARAQADQDNRRPFAAVAAVASASSQPPRDPAADSAAKAEKPSAAGSDGVVPSKGRVLTPDGKLMCVNVYSTDKNFEVIPLENQGMIYVVIETARGGWTLEYTRAKCDELATIAKGIDEITSVSSLAGYEIRTEGRRSDAGTCLIQLKNASDRKLTSRQIIEKLAEKCRTMHVNLDFFESPADSVFVATGGFSVRVLDKTNSNNDKWLGRVPETFMDDLLNRKDLEGLFTFFASNYPQYELVINNDLAMQKRVSIANAMENLSIVIGSSKFRRLAEDFANLFIKNDRGEMVPHISFMQLKKK